MYGDVVNNSISLIKSNYQGLSHHVQDLNRVGMTKRLTLVRAICSVALNKPAVSSAVVLSDLSIGGTIIKVEELANTLQVCLNI